MGTYPIRLVAEDELAAFLAVDQHASHGAPMSGRARANFLARLEFGRTLAAFDGDTIAGGTGAFSFQMRVPGAMAAVAGVSLVAVLPSHRRQGILSALMRRQLADVSERGEAVAVLFASESGIYGRFGYGRASWHAAHRLQRGEGTLAPGAPADPGRTAVGQGRAGSGLRPGAGRAARPVRPHRAMVGPPAHRPALRGRVIPADTVRPGRGRLGAASVCGVHLHGALG